MIKQILFLGLLLAIPTVTAEATVEGSYQTYNLDTYANARDNPPSAALFVNTVSTTPTHDFNIESSYAILTISYTARFPDSSAGVWRYEAFWDDIAIPECIWQLETVNNLATPAHIPFTGIQCRIADASLAVGDHEFIVTRSILSGTPAAINHETVSYSIERTDLLVPDMTNEILDAFSAIVPFLALILIIIWAEITREWLIYILGVFVAGIAMVAVWNEVESLRLVIGATALLLVARAYFTFQDDKTAISEE